MPKQETIKTDLADLKIDNIQYITIWSLNMNVKIPRATERTKLMCETYKLE